MKILARDLFENKDVELTGKLTTDHSQSSYGQSVMIIEEWDDGLMDQFNWTIFNCQVMEFEDEIEQEQFSRWLM